MSGPMDSAPNTGVIRSSVPERIDRLPWAPFHTRMVIALGVAWVLDGLEITIAGVLSDETTLGLSSTAVGAIATHRRPHRCWGQRVADFACRAPLGGG